MKFFTKEDFLKIGLEMIVLLGRNGVKRFQKYDVWNPGKNPYKTIAIFNKVTVWIAPEVRSWLKVFVKTWDYKSGKKIYLEPKFSNGSMIFQARTRLEIEITDYGRSKKIEFLVARYTADNNGTLRPELISNSKKIQDKEKPLSMHMEISTKLEPVPMELISNRKNEKWKQKKITDKPTIKSGFKRKKNRPTNNQLLRQAQV